MSFFSGITSYFSSDPAAKLTAAKAKVTEAETALQAAKDEVSSLESSNIGSATPVGDGGVGGRRRKGKKSKRTRRTTTRSRNGRKPSRP